MLREVLWLSSPKGSHWHHVSIHQILGGQEEEARVLRLPSVILEILIRILRFEMAMTSFFLAVLASWPRYDTKWKMKTQQTTSTASFRICARLWNPLSLLSHLPCTHKRKHMIRFFCHLSPWRIIFESKFVYSGPGAVLGMRVMSINKTKSLLWWTNTKLKKEENKHKGINL